MSVKLDRMTKDFMSAIKASKKTTEAYDTEAQVTRVDGDTAWVHIAGGIDETPVKMTINCEKGDTVQIRVGGGSAWIVGNETAPPTDDTTALQARVKSIEAELSAKRAQELAENAYQKVVDETQGFVDAIVAINDDIEDLQDQIDGNITTWFYAYVPTASNAPASDWTTTEEKNNHLGDLFYDTTTGYAYRWMLENGVYSWARITDTDVTTALANASQAQDTADAKRRVFTSQPTPPYDAGDLWFQGSTGDILTCINPKTENQSYSSSDWSKLNKYTDDSSLNTFLSNTYATDKTNLQGQIDGKAETWYQSGDPSTAWTTTALKQQHEGDLWYNTTDSTTWYWNGSSWVQQNVPTAVFDKIDGKAQIFTSQPTPPYNVGDLWFNSTTSDIMTCIRARTSGSYVASDWQKRNKYTDDTRADEAYNLASNAKSSADGKNTVYRQSTQPTGGTYVAGDIWFDTANDNRINRYNGSTWVQFTLGDDAIGNLNASHINAGTIDASQVTVSNIDAGNITSGKLDTNRLNVSTIISVGDIATETDVDTAETNASKVASEYLSVISGTTGISVHDAKTPNPSTYSDNYVNITSNAINVATGGVNVAQFGSTTRIGKVSETRMELDYHSLKMTDKEGDSYVYFSDLRGSDGTLTTSDTIEGDGETQRFPLSYTPITILGVTLNGSTLSSDHYFAVGSNIQFDYSLFDTDVAVVTYTTESQIAKGYTIGLRKTPSDIGGMSLVEGYNNDAIGNYSHAEGYTTTAQGLASHAEGYTTTANGKYSHAEGYGTVVSGNYSHAEGYNTTAGVLGAHAEGYGTTAQNGRGAHAEGAATTASESGSHAEGGDTVANKACAHAEGLGTIASALYQHVQGTYNVEGAYADIVGGGTDGDNRANISALDWNGNLRLKGDVYVGCSNNSTGGIKLTPAFSNVGGTTGYVAIGKLGISWGLTSITSSSSGTASGGVTTYAGSTEVTYIGSPTYKYNPVVLATWAGNYANQVSISTPTITTTKFTVNGRLLTASSERSIRWLAIGQLA